MHVSRLTQKNLLNRINACDTLLKLYVIDSFSKRKATGSDSQVTYDNDNQKNSWPNCNETAQTIANPGLMAKKSFVEYLVGLKRKHPLWDASLVPITQFKFLLSAIGQIKASNRPELANRKGVVFYQDNARPRTSSTTCHKLREFRLEMLLHPTLVPNSSDLELKDCHLFKHLKKFLDGKQWLMIISWSSFSTTEARSSFIKEL